MIATIFKKIPFWVSLVALGCIIYDLGFNQTDWEAIILRGIYGATFALGLFGMIAIYTVKTTRPKSKVWAFDLLYFLFVGIALMVVFGWRIPFFQHPNTWKYLAVIFVFVREFSILKINFSRQYLNPAQLFIVSFLVIIISGMLLLMLPNATNSGISSIDALFTSTSAVCVTGLTVVDTGTYFTTFGQVIIIILIQVGGLGIMTFTSYFSYFFRGGSSYENQLMLREMTNSEKIAEVFSTLKKILLLTAFIELMGAIFIFFSIDPALIPNFLDRAFFAAFHSISAFCNAGFSTLPTGFYDVTFRFNYPLQLMICFLIIMGGIGFPILLNFLTFVKSVTINRIKAIGIHSQYAYKPWLLNMNSRIVMIITGILLLFGTVMFYVLEYNNTLYEHGPFGKVVVSFFNAVTPRTAGFNDVDMSALTFGTTMIIIFLMWVGASPGGTGGGIKTTTFAIGTLNFFSLARGKNRIEVFHREISQGSVNRAFAAISLSLIIVGIAVFMISIFDRKTGLLQIAFECFSAYSTSGLSLGITAGLSSESKLVLVACMFIGRVSMLTIMIALFRQVRNLRYRYPSEEILIN
jgi:trk system potassium uptake protein